MKHTVKSLDKQLDYSHKLWSTAELWQDEEDISNKNYFLSALVVALGEHEVKHVDIQSSLTGDGFIAVRLFTESSVLIADADKKRPLPRVVIIARRSLEQIRLVKYPYVGSDNEGEAGDVLLELHYRNLEPLQIGSNFQRWDNYKDLKQFHTSLMSDLG